eukprot:INCI7621.4.p1 GENE.INCI7621.4~~INCI7621.4.p1  ORF type:complete len:645 (+),score=100.94 INCI7621.4:322-2256(+)
MSQTPLFDEWVNLAGSASLEELTSGTDAALKSALTKDDALIVIDVQRDFVPRSAQNRDGGRLGCPEGEFVIAPIVDLIRQASAVGATIIASRDYHPHDHCSFACTGGPFPAHCVQGTAGSKFVPAVARALEEAMELNGPERTLVAFKAMHEAIDSFGAIPYHAAPFGTGRIVSNVELLGDEAKQSFQEHGKCMGCSDAPWTGSLVLKQSAIAHVTQLHSEIGNPEDQTAKYDADAPPDVLAVLRDGVDRKLRTMHDVLKANMGAPEETGGRIFVCGLTLDLCVLDTCLNARALGLPRVSMCVDAARAAHVAGVGGYGSGFLADPRKVRESLETAGVGLVQTAHLLPDGQRRTDAIAGDAGIKFPESLGTLSLRLASGLRIKLLATAPLRRDPSQETATSEKEKAAAAAAENAAVVTASPKRSSGEEQGFAQKRGANFSVDASQQESSTTAMEDDESVADTTGHGAGRYSLALVGPLAPLAGGGGGARAFRNTGIVSPRSPIPPGWPAVPPNSNATHICWAYPMSDVSAARLGEEAGKAFLAISASAELRFAAYGGFLLLDPSGNVVGAQALGDESDSANTLQFASPKPWRREFTAQLEAERRLQKVTLPALKSRGADRFCWLGPHETFAAGPERWQPTATGGFL